MGGCILYCEYTGTVKSPYYYLFHLFRPLHYVVWACMLVVSVRGRCCSSWCTVMSFVFRRDPSHKQLRWCTDSCVVPWLSMAAHAPRPLHAQQLETFGTQKRSLSSTCCFGGLTMLFTDFISGFGVQDYCIGSRILIQDPFSS